MQLKLYDTLTRKKREFVPLDWERGLPESERRVRMYVCGPTVYDFAHIGNARPVIVFDVLFRLLRHLYGADRVVYVRNITDVDDRINARAAGLGIPIRKLTQQTYKDFAADAKALGCLPPTFEPRATNYIHTMRKLIDRLISQGNAYVARSHVLFDVRSMPEYGQLSKRTLDEMMAGARVEVAPYKRNPMDFVLWKPSKRDEPAWRSPGGIKKRGRPGWHIECSAMAWRRLGKTFDIHGGGIDLVFPHHENEIAQSRSAFHTPLMARFWMHNGFLQLEGEKMAKSVGNVVTIRELLSGWNGRVWDQSEIRFLMLSTHYAQPLDWTLHGLEEARRITSDWKKITAQVDHDRIDIKPSPQIFDALVDDLNTPEAIYFLHQQAKLAVNNPTLANDLYSDLVFLGLFADRRLEAERGSEEIKQQELPPVGVQLDSSEQVVQFHKQYLEDHLRLVISSFNPTANVISTTASVASNVGLQHDVQLLKPWTKFGPKFISSPDMDYITDKIGIQRLNERIEKRLEARRLKDFEEADRIRKELADMGIALKDSKDGTTWELAR
jgi:cysteinyl-tRNA synthetase